MTETHARLKRFFLFGSGAALSFSGTLAITFVTTAWLRLPEELSFAISLIVMFFVNFSYLRWVVFRATGTKWLSQLRKFFMTSIGFRCAEYVAFLILLDIFHVHYLLSVVGVLGVSFLIKFQVFDKHVFHTRY